MRILILLFCLIVFIFYSADAQFTHFGLQGIKVTDLEIYGDTLYTATTDSGVYRRNLHDTDG
jgi:hypothetical protein